MSWSATAAEEEECRWWTKLTFLLEWSNGVEQTHSLMLRRLRQSRLTESISRRSWNDDVMVPSNGLALSEKTESPDFDVDSGWSSTTCMLFLRRWERPSSSSSSSSSCAVRLSTIDTSNNAFMAVIRFCRWAMCISSEVEWSLSIKKKKTTKAVFSIDRWRDPISDYNTWWPARHRRWIPVDGLRFRNDNRGPSKIEYWMGRDWVPAGRDKPRSCTGD